MTSLKTLYSARTACSYVIFDCYNTHLLFPKYRSTGLHKIKFLPWIRNQIFINSPHAIHTSRIIFSTASHKQSIRLIYSLFQVSPCLQHAFTIRTKGHHLDTFRTVIFSFTFPVINLVTLTTPYSLFFFVFPARVLFKAETIVVSKHHTQLGHMGEWRYSSTHLPCR